MDLLIVGAGELGERVGREWKKRHPQDEVVAETKSSARHKRLKWSGLVPRLREDRDPLAAPRVLIAIPPQDNYQAEIQRALELWDSSGPLVMISSTSVYGEAKSEGQIFDESSRVNPQDSSAKLLVAAEKQVLDHEGTIIRMAGLYGPNRGPHRIYLKKGQMDGSGERLVNLIHYDDAAALVVSALTKAKPGNIFLGCDGRPLTRKQIAEATWTNRTDLIEPNWEPRRPEFLGKIQEPPSKICENPWTRQVLDWTPQWKSFEDWAYALHKPT